MDEMKVHIWYVVLWNVKNYKNGIKTPKKIFSVYSHGVTTCHKSKNGFQSFEIAFSILFHHIHFLLLWIFTLYKNY